MKDVTQRHSKEERKHRHTYTCTIGSKTPSVKDTVNCINTVTTTVGTCRYFNISSVVVH